MAKIEKWIIAARMVEVLDAETEKELINMGGLIAGGWCQVHQHIIVTPENKERIESYLREKGYQVLAATEFGNRMYPSGGHGPH